MTNNHLLLYKTTSLSLVLYLALMPFACTTNTQRPTGVKDSLDILDPWSDAEVIFEYEEFDTIEGKKCHHVDKAGSIECSARKNGCDGFHGNLWDDSCWSCPHLRDEHY